MGNQESIPSIEHHSFYKKDLKRYLTVYGKKPVRKNSLSSCCIEILGDVQISPFRGVFERYFLHRGDKPETFRIQAVGLSDEEKKYIVMTGNNNIRLSTTGAIPVLQAHSQRRNCQMMHCG